MIRLVVVMVVVLLASSCTGLRKVPKGELLYTGAKVEFVQAEKIAGKGTVNAQAKKVVRPKPNAKILGMRPRLWFYYHTREPKKPKGIRNWFKYKLGQPPVYLSNVDAALVSKGIDAGLYNTGFFDSYSQYQVKEGKNGKTASLVFTIFLNKPFTIQKVTFPTGTDTLSRSITRASKRSVLKTDDRYSLANLIEERERIDTYLKRRGYYYFRPDYLLFKMDTNTATRTLNLELTLKPNSPEKALIIYHIAEVNVYPDFNLADSAGTKMLFIDSINYYKASKYIRPRPVLNAVFYKPGQTYSSRIHQLTLSRLNGLGIFKFINVDLRDRDTTSKGLLSVNVYLTPLPRKSISIEVQAATKSNNFIGPGLNFSLRNRNAFKGAELLTYSLRASFETQYSGEYKGLFTFEINPKVELTIPRLIVPFKTSKNKVYVSTTRISAEYAYLSRVGYFDMNTVKLMYGYKWKDSPEIDHELVPLSINFYNIYHTSDKFKELIASNALISDRFKEQFIPGIMYSFFYNEQVKARRKNQFYFNGNVELAGNLVSLLSRIGRKEFGTADNPASVLGVNYAQFARLDVDIRNYYHTTTNTTLAARFIAGWGIPFGNSSSLPYARQFFSGGAYSLRGFPGNSVGPGGYMPPDTISNVFYLQQGGEIKLEVNLEYRFPIFNVLKGAVFADAGNTWLNKANTDAPGGEFKWNRFVKEIALSAGAGLRVDLKFFVFRLDLAVPVRKPSLPENERWIIKNLRPSNLLFNIAFGYPF